MDDFSRYQSQIHLAEIGKEGQKRLLDSRVLLVGLGGLGCPAAQYLVAAGVGTLGLMDGDLVDISNLNRQVLFTKGDVGDLKVKVAGRNLAQQNEQIKMEEHPVFLTADNALEIFSAYDVILDGTDNLETKYLINDACVKLGKPFVGASIFKYQGQIAAFNYDSGPTYRCLFPYTGSAKIPSCEVEGVIGVVPGFMGVLLAAEGLKLILKIGKLLSGKVQVWNLLTLEQHTISFSRNDEVIDSIRAAPLCAEQVICQFIDEKAHYLDVREMHEQPQPVDISCLQIPVSELQQRQVEIPRDQELRVFCQTGARSKEAVTLLKDDFGFSNLVDMGGIDNLIR